MRPQTVKLLEENIGKNLLDIGLGNDFLDMTPKAQAAKAKINNWNYIKLKLLHSKRNNPQNEKAACEMGENICKLCI